MKSHIICHMMGPIDGQLFVDNWSPSTGRSSDDLVAEYDKDHEALACDAWISGRAVGDEFADSKPNPLTDVASVIRPVHIAREGADEYAILIDQHGKLHWKGPETYGAALVMVLGRDVPDAHLAELASDGISYIVADGDEIDLEQVLDVLSSRFGIKRLLLEGGAHTRGTFLKAKVVDEISLVLFPAIGGRSGSASLFDAGPDGLADTVRLALTANEMRRNGVVHLRYAVTYR